MVARGGIEPPIPFLPLDKYLPTREKHVLDTSRIKVPVSESVSEFYGFDSP